MYVCTCEKLTMKDGSIVRRGQPVPEALEWPEHIVRANKRMGYIAEAPKSQTSVVGAAASVTVEPVKVAAPPSVPAATLSDESEPGAGSSSEPDKPKRLKGRKP